MFLKALQIYIVFRLRANYSEISRVYSHIRISNQCYVYNCYKYLSLGAIQRET